MPAERPAVPSFWDFSLAFYAMPGVADACLQLQDGCGADVNVLLFLLYRARDGYMLSAAEVPAAEVPGLFGRPLGGPPRLAAA